VDFELYRVFQGVIGNMEKFCCDIEGLSGVRCISGINIWGIGLPNLGISRLPFELQKIFAKNGSNIE